MVCNRKSGPERRIPQPLNVLSDLLEMIYHIEYSSTEDKARAYQQHAQNNLEDQINTGVSIQINAKLIGKARHCHQQSQPQHYAQQIGC